MKSFLEVKQHWFLNTSLKLVQSAAGDAGLETVIAVGLGFGAAIYFIAHHY